MDRTESFRDLFGTWASEDLREFTERTADLLPNDPHFDHVEGLRRG